MIIIITIIIFETSSQIKAKLSEAKNILINIHIVMMAPPVIQGMEMFVDPIATGARAFKSSSRRSFHIN